MNPAPVVPEDVGPGDEPDTAEDNLEHVEMEKSRKPMREIRMREEGQQEETIPVTVVSTPHVKTPVHARQRIHAPPV
jgi:hypothetical protein